MDGKKLLAAVGSPLTLAVTAAGGVTFALSNIWWLLPVTAGAAVILTATQYATAPAAPALREPYAGRETALLAQMARIEATLAQSKGPVRDALAELPRQIGNMRGKVRGLLERQAKIDAFVAEEPQSHARTTLQKLERSRDSARTPDARDKFSRAIENKKAEMESRENLAAQSERIAAELADIESALAGTLTKIVSLEDLQDEAVRESTAGISNRLTDVLSTVEALEQALSEVIDPTRQRVRT